MNVSAQEFAIEGSVVAKGSEARLAEVSVKNLRTNQYSLSNDFGNFKINVRTGDSLLFSKSNYIDFKIAVKEETGLIVRLQPGIMLNQVTVTAKSKKEEMQEVLNDYHKKGVFYNGKPPLLSYIFKPLTALYELFGKTPARARRFNNYYQNELEQSEVDKKFNKLIVRQYAGLPDDKISDFMVLYRPSFEKIKYWNDYDVISYIKSSSKDYKEKGTPRAALDSLPKLAN